MEQEEKDIQITNEQYKKINNYYNNLCLGLSINDSLFLDNLYIFGVLGSKVLEVLDDIYLKGKTKEDCFTFLEIYEKAKEIIKDINLDYVDFSSVTRNRFNEGLLEELKDFEELEDKYNKTPYLKNRYETKEEYIVSKYNSDYRYFIGGILAYYSLYNLSKDDVLRLNEALKNNKEIRFSGAMKELGIELNFDTLEESLKCIKKYAKENNLYKKEENNMKM